ncbi:MAG: hypothetical protein EOP05_15830 [Proteobacteria bacterium]|nr:MAG: hypothetical protein EOP05_15830 [Pseudomonadota bacterium]
MMKTRTALTTLICALAFSVAAHGADDDVFLDEGNGDFDQMPISQPVAEEPAAAPAQAPSEPMPMLTEEAGQEPSQMPGMDSAPVQEPAKPVKKAKKEKVAKVEEAPVEQTEAPAPKAKKTAKKASGAGAGGKFVTTKEACPMMRSPASTAETMLTVKPARKIWVEKAGDGWVKGWNKAGEEGFISTDCVE